MLQLVYVDRVIVACPIERPTSLEAGMEKVIRTIQPPHESENITLEQATRAWIKVEARRQARRSHREAPSPHSAAVPR